MRDFKKLKIWQKGFEIVVKAYKFTAFLPNTERFGLTSQINRAAVSIISNIAEGSSRLGNNDNRRFIDISIGSSYELETHVLICQEVNFGPPDLIKELLSLIDEEQRMLTAFRNSLNCS